jgi:hypothetical protein
MPRARPSRQARICLSRFVNHSRPKVAPGRNQRTARAMSEADRLLHNILEAGDVVGRDPAGRVVIQLAMPRRDFEALMAFGAIEVENEDGGEYELSDAPTMSAREAPKFFLGSHCKLDSLPISGSTR